MKHCRILIRKILCLTVPEAIAAAGINLQVERKYQNRLSCICVVHFRICELNSNLA